MRAGNDTTRDINRRVILNLVRSRQPASRADLARYSGLQRSTVSLIVDQLLAAGWLIEGPTGRLPRGRRPVYLRLNERRAVIAIDIRPGDTTLAAADVNGRFLSQQIFPTPRNPHAGLKSLAAKARALIAAHGHLVFEGIGVSLPGRVDSATGRLIFAPNLKWGPCDIAAPLARATGLSVALENAANACALAQAWSSGGRPADLVVITVSEGIGAGIFANGQLVRGPRGMAGEFGHSVLDPGGPRCSCGNCGCWEVFASNRAAIRYYLEQGNGGRAPTYPDLLALAEQGDSRAFAALQRQAAYLARGAGLLANGLAPARLVFVGEIARAWDRLGPVVEKEVAARSLAGRRVQVSAADDGAQARLRGTVALVLQRYFAMPSYT
ncbi:MAG: ROK family protein [Bryobacteraceae bacterium]